MAKPWNHARSSVNKFGGVPEDYIEIHNFMDSSKATIADNRHRALTHNSWFLSVVLERVFGVVFINSAGREVSVRAVGEQHVAEDCKGVIPSAQDYLQEMEHLPWMAGQGWPPSHARIGRETDARFQAMPKEISWESTAVTSHDKD